MKSGILLLLLLAVGASACSDSPPRTTAANNAAPLPMPEAPSPPVQAVGLEGDDLERARKLYDGTCAKCHTTSGVGEHHHAKDGIPNFTDASWQQRTPDGELTEAIANGKGKHMPAFKAKITDDEIRLLVRYVRGFPDRIGKMTAMSGKPGTRHSGVGVVIAVDAALGRITIDHEKIAGYMDAMSMTHSVKDPALLAGLAARDRVRFTIEETDSDDVIVELAKVAHGAHSH